MEGGRFVESAICDEGEARGLGAIAAIEMKLSESGQDLVFLVPELIGYGADTVAGFFSECFMGTQGKRDGGEMHTGFSSDVLYGDALGRRIVGRHGMGVGEWLTGGPRPKLRTRGGGEA